MAKIDLFISHASEDEDEIARPLAERLRGLGYNVWYDKLVLKLGDNLRQEIDKGLAACRFGVVVLSHSFFAKHFPQVELDGLAAREGANGQKIILPIWHDLTYGNVAKYSPTLAGKLAAKTSDGLDKVVAQIVEVLGPPEIDEASINSVANGSQGISVSHPRAVGPTPPPALQRPVSAATDAGEAIERAKILLSEHNQSRWHRFVDSTLRSARERMLDVRKTVESTSLDNDKLSRACQNIVTASAPIIATALRAAESEQPLIRDQRWLLDELPLIKGWHQGGIVAVTSLHYVSVVAYHHMLGGFLLQSRRHHEAIDLWLHLVARPNSENKTDLWRAHHLVSYVNALGGRNNQVWPFIKGLYASQSWLSNFFDDAVAYEDSVRTYLWLGSIIELAEYVKKGGRVDGKESISFDISPAFLDPLPEIGELHRSIRQAIPSRELMERITGHFGVQPAAVRDAWPRWLGAMFAWHRSARDPFFRVSDVYFGSALPTLP